MFLTRLKVKQRFSVLMLAMLLFTFGLTAMSAPTANAACPVQNCHPEPDPNDLPVPALGNVMFHITDQIPSSYRIISLKMTYYTVSNNQYVSKSRTAYPTDIINPTNLTNYIDKFGTYAMFKSVRVVTDKPTLFTAYGQYANGSYGYKYATIQYTTSEKLHYCGKWAIGGYPNLRAQGFYPNYNCP